MKIIIIIIAILTIPAILFAQKNQFISLHYEAARTQGKFHPGGQITLGGTFNKNNKDGAGIGVTRQRSKFALR